MSKSDDYSASCDSLQIFLLLNYSMRYEKTKGAVFLFLFLFLFSRAKLVEFLFLSPEGAIFKSRNRERYFDCHYLR